MTTVKKGFGSLLKLIKSQNFALIANCRTFGLVDQKLRIQLQIVRFKLLKLLEKLLRRKNEDPKITKKPYQLKRLNKVLS